MGRGEVGSAVVTWNPLLPRINCQTDATANIASRKLLMGAVIIIRFYRPQTKFAKVMFLQVSVCPRLVWCVWGACMVGTFVVGGVHGRGGMHGRGMGGGGHAWQGACMAGGMYGRGHAWWGVCRVGACMAEGAYMAGGVHRGHAWWGACMAGDMHGGGHAWQGVHSGGGHAWQWGNGWQILRDTVNERAVRILLECILVRENVHMKFSDHVITIYFSPSSNTNRETRTCQIVLRKLTQT